MVVQAVHRFYVENMANLISRTVSVAVGQFVQILAEFRPVFVTSCPPTLGTDWCEMRTKRKQQKPSSDHNTVFSQKAGVVLRPARA